MKIENIFQVPSVHFSKDEIFEALVENKNVVIERIISYGQVTAKDVWLEEERNEWVCLLQGSSKLMLFDDSEINLKQGDFFLIPAKTKHKVIYTSANPPCIWLAVHFNLPD